MQISRLNYCKGVHISQTQVVNSNGILSPAGAGRRPFQNFEIPAARSPFRNINFSFLLHSLATFCCVINVCTSPIAPCGWITGWMEGMDKLVDGPRSENDIQEINQHRKQNKNLQPYHPLSITEKNIPALKERYVPSARCPVIILRTDWPYIHFT